MPALLKQKKPQLIYLAQWDHKHGQDISAHTTHDGAFKQCVEWARETLEEWLPYLDERATLYYEEMGDKELISEWGEITGYAEFFKVDSLALNKDCPNLGCHCGACENNK